MTPTRRRLISLLAVVCGVAAASAAPPATSPSPVKYFGRFAELPVGAVKPKGWIAAWLARQSAGMTGHPENLGHPYNTVMYAGRIPPPAIKHGESWWGYEQSGYFVDAATRLELMQSSPETAKLAKANLDYIEANSGPAKLGESTWGWPNAVVARALMAKHSATGDPAAAKALEDCLLGTRNLGGRDGYVFEPALYLYGKTGDERYLALARRAYDRYFVTDPKSFSQLDKLNGARPLREHGVTAAEQLKLLPMLYIYTGDTALLDLAKTAYRKVEADALMPDGGFVSSESLGTAAFNSLHETCDLTDWSWSMGYQLLATGDGHWADRIEQVTFNALPGAVTKDFKQVQYFSSPNQLVAGPASNVRLAPTRMWYRPSHETECCSGNVNRAMPNYVARMWARTDDGIAALLLGPCEVTTDVAGTPVTVVEETDYPFRDTITFRVRSASPATFTLSLRVPGWCDAAAVSLNGVALADAPTPAGGFATVRRQFRDGDTVTLTLPMTVKTRPWYGNRAASVERGPLVYALKIDETPVVTKEDSPGTARAMKGNTLAGFPAIAYFPASAWRYGRASDTFAVKELPVAENPFDPATPPVHITATLTPLPQWEPGWSAVPGDAQVSAKTSTKNVAALPDDAAVAAAGPGTDVTLVPLGATHLRLTTFPLTKQATP